MPPLKLIPPEELKTILEEHGLSVVAESEFHWFLAKEDHGEPICIPKEPGEDGCVPMDVMEHSLYVAQISHHRYFELKEKIQKKYN